MIIPYTKLPSFSAPLRSLRGNLQVKRAEGAWQSPILPARRGHGLLQPTGLDNFCVSAIIYFLESREFLKAARMDSQKQKTVCRRGRRCKKEPFMKKMGKFVGIIAVLLIIGGMVSCDMEAKPEDQIQITFTGLPAKADNNFAFIGLLPALPASATEEPNIVAISSALKKITGGNATGYMEFANEKGKAFGKNDNYYIAIQIYSNEAGTGEPIYSGWTSEKQKVDKGPNTYAANKLIPDIEDYFYEPPSTFFGTYTGTGATDTTVETIVFNATTFRISDNSAITNPYLNFTIQDFEEVAVNSSYAEYTTAFKFTGKITDASPSSGSNSYIGSTKTAPGTTASDINTTVFHMYIYAKGSGSGFTFVRTAFTKQSDWITADKTDVITKADNTTARVYTKQ
jgi:hypothetical protein